MHFDLWEELWILFGDNDESFCPRRELMYVRCVQGSTNHVRDGSVQIDTLAEPSCFGEALLSVRARVPPH